VFYNKVSTLRRSRIRSDTLSFLVDLHPEAAPLCTIAAETGHSASDVAGAIRGLKSRFHVENSLIRQGLVEPTNIDGRTYYKASDEGMSTLRRIMSSESLRLRGRVTYRVTRSEQPDRIPQNTRVISRVVR
jgi:predicted transcriptional regulator with HTH domain